MKTSALMFIVIILCSSSAKSEDYNGVWWRGIERQIKTQNQNATEEQSHLWANQLRQYFIEGFTRGMFNNETTLADWARAWFEHYPEYQKFQDGLGVGA